ncbi:MAG: capsular polysaccharide synthesis protein [Muribaculaceae bacterium]|nr:capsular polysaccharide synthesis protein [Muribaculaceae bacterium]
MSSSFDRFLGRIGQQSHLILIGHILNAPWKSREERRKQRYAATSGAAMRYLQRYAKAVRGFAPEDMDMTPEPEKAYTIWFQGEHQAPDLVKACFRSMRRHLKQELVVLDQKSLFEMISLPDYIMEKWKAGKIPHTQFSDICRVELLYRHGGVWLDATDYVTAPIPQYIMDEDFFLFMAGEKIRGSYAMIQSCFIRGKKGNPLLDIWRQAIYAYWKEENSKINYFVHHLLLKLAVENNVIAASNFSKMPKIDQDPTHALWGEHCMDKFSKEEFDRLTAEAFFQKTNYKDKRLGGDIHDTIAEYILNS